MTDSKAIAGEIIRQLGGNKLIAMTGAKNFIALESGAAFTIGRNAAGINAVRIKLNGMDLYDVEYGRMAKKKGIPTFTKKAEDLGLYADMLVASFEAATGMYLSF